jgi:1-acyl-sn-glycerol-3-phosphate acyltransferase
MLEGLGISNSPEDIAKIQSVFADLKKHYANYSDPWGFDLDTCQKAMELFLPFYKKYFKVRVFGQENITDKNYMVVSNHTGQLPIDGMLVTIAFAFDLAPPRLLRGMIERFMAQLPFLGDLTAQTGSILGDRKNCTFLLNKGESILVFPEGVRGISKNTPDYYKVQEFSNGFYRIALQSQTDILPICVVGAEEMFPYVYHAKAVAKWLGLPSLPLSLNLFPLPSPIDIHIGKPIPIAKLNPEAPDKEIRTELIQIENTIKRMLQEGLNQRRSMKEVWTKEIKDVVLEMRKKYESR